MPKLKLNLPQPSTPWTRVPNVLFDRLLPNLKDTELRILLVLIRQTYGWSREGQAVSMPYRTLMKRTGRRTEAIAKALRSLRRQGFIHSLDADAQSSTWKAVAGNARKAKRY